MKKFLLFLVVLLGAAAFLYDPHLKPYLGPYIDPILSKAKGLGETAPEESGSQAASPTGAPPPSVPAPGSTTKAPAPAAPQKVGAPPASVPTPAQTKEMAASTPPASSPRSEVDAILEKRFPMPNIKPLEVLVGNWQAVPPKAFPAQVTIQQKLAFSLRDDRGNIIGSSVMDRGNIVVPVALNGTTLTVASPANQNMRSTLPVEMTDFKQRIENTYTKFVSDRKGKIVRLRELSRAQVESELASGTSASAQDGQDPRFAAVRESLKRGELRAARLEEATNYYWNGPERINGKVFNGTYDAVTVNFDVHTIFGVFPIVCKCLLRNGKVEGWIDPETMEERI